MSSLSADYAYDVRRAEPATRSGWLPSRWRYAATAAWPRWSARSPRSWRIAYLARAVDGGSVLDWALAVVLGVLGVGYLARLRRRAHAAAGRRRPGRPDPARVAAWRGLPWGAIEEVEHQPRRGLRRDGRLVLVRDRPERLLEGLDASGRRQARWAERLHGSPFAVPLALSTRVVRQPAVT